jgi:gamma-glutamyl phosphate reductase
LTFVKYAVPEDITEEQKKQLIEKLQNTLDAKMAEIEELYNSDIEEAKDNVKKQKEVERLYVSNKELLTTEFNRLKSIVSDLHFGSTILESDYRNVFYRYNDVIKFVSGPE